MTALKNQNKVLDIKLYNISQMIIWLSEISDKDLFKTTWNIRFNWANKLIYFLSFNNFKIILK